MVITIIVMLILAGVSINAIVGEDGILAKATNATLISEEAARREALDMILLDYNSSEFLGEAGGMHKFLSKIKGEGQIGNYAITTDEDYAIIKYDNKSYEIVRESEGSSYYKISDEVDGTILEDGDNIILTQKTLDTEDGFTFDNGKSYIVLDEKLTADEFDFNIQAGDPVTIKIMHDMDIDNEDVPNRSAINLEDGATLNLYVYGKVNVNSSFGEAGQAGVVAGAEGGVGANAGIHVTKNSTLNLYGTGILTAQGGNAGAGGDSFKSDLGGAGGGGAGAGIGGNGGKGGNAGAGNHGGSPEGCSQDSGKDGEAGEDCGTVNIYNTLTVYAYGGAGGSGGADATDTGGTGAGGGYPGAGIGGGGAGGRWF